MAQADFFFPFSVDLKKIKSVGAPGLWAATTALQTELFWMTWSFELELLPLTKNTVLKAVQEVYAEIL